MKVRTANGDEIDVTNVVVKNAWVEVECGISHSSIYIPGKGHKCRYARGNVKHVNSGLTIKSHDCHNCVGYFLMKATAPKKERVCDNCGGPVIPSGQSSCWPSLLMLADFVDL